MEEQLAKMVTPDFEDKTHTYHLDGIVLPSVTTIMKPLSDAKYKNIDERTLNNAADRGTVIHNAVENLVKFDFEDIPQEYSGYMDAFKRWYLSKQPEILGTEIRTYHKTLYYAGTIDCLAKIGGEMTLIDYKSTSTVIDMTCGVQLEAYAQALESQGITVQRKMILHLKKDGSYKEHYYPVKDMERWRVFNSLKIVYDYINT